MIDASPRRLQVFKHVVEMDGFNAAAARLGIAQPSVGAHIKALERQAGQPLFVRRRGARPQLTEAGRVLYAMAIEIIRLSEEASARLDSLRSRRTRELVIAAHRDLAASFLPPYLSAFSRKNPRSRVVTRIGTIEDVMALVESGAAELGILLSAGPARGAGSVLVGREPLDLVAGKAHPLARVRGVTAEDLGRHDFVTGLRTSRYFRMIDRALRAIGVGDLEGALELQESAAVKEAVRLGRHIACLPRCTVRHELASGDLVALDLARPLTPVDIRCVHATELGPMARRMMDALTG